MCGGRDSRVLKYDVEERSRGSRLSLLLHWPGKGRNLLRDHYRLRLQNSRSAITIVSPYFIPHQWLLFDLASAVKRGVQVKIVLPEITDPPILSIINRIFVHAMRGIGISFYFTKEMLHAKALLIDDLEGTVGSQNIDGLSFDFNVEGGVFFTQKNMIHDLKKIIERLISRATLFQADQYVPTWYEALLVPVAKLIQPIL